MLIFRPVSGSFDTKNISSQSFGVLFEKEELKIRWLLYIKMFFPFWMIFWPHDGYEMINLILLQGGPPTSYKWSYNPYK